MTGSIRPATPMPPVQPPMDVISVFNRSLPLEELNARLDIEIQRVLQEKVEEIKEQVKNRREKPPLPVVRIVRIRTKPTEKK